MELTRIQTNDKRYIEAEALMESAFPATERRPADQQREYTEENMLFHPHIIWDNHAFIGILNYWILNGFVYIEHFAIVPELRKRGYGKRALRCLMADTTLPIVLEAEPPTDETSKRRIAFYEQQGFTLWEREYIQPPYAPHLPEVPLKLMVHGGLKMETDFDTIKKEIRNHVYGLK